MAQRRLAIFLIISFFSGIFLAPDIFVDIRVSVTVISLFVFLGFFLRQSLLIFVPFIIVGFFVGNLFFNYYSQKALDKKSFQDGMFYELKGSIKSYPQEKEKSITFVFQTNKQDIHISVPKIGEYNYGQVMTVKGKINIIDNSDEFNFKEYFLSRNISYQMFYPTIYDDSSNQGNAIFRFLFSLRRVFENTINDVFVKPYSSFVLGLLLGVKSLSSNLMDMFSIVSLSHIIVVSGYNLSIIAESMKGVFAPLSRRLSFWLPMTGIWMFTLMIGAEPPVTRAAIMASVLLFSKKSGRKADGVSTLLLAALFLVVISPYVLRYDPGFQLSFLSTLGIILFSDDIVNFLNKIKIPKFLSEIISATLSAQLLILPVISYYFGRVSLIGPIANFIVLPFIPIVMFLSFIAILLGMLNLNVAITFSYIPVLVLFSIIKISEFLSTLTFSSLAFKVDYIFLIIYFLITGMLYLLKTKHENFKNN